VAFNTTGQALGEGGGYSCRVGAEQRRRLFFCPQDLPG